MKIIIYKREDKILGFKIEGHANYADHGEDIVCSAVSVLAQTAIVAIDELTTIKSFDYKVESGDTYIKVPYHLMDDKAEVIFETFKIGVKGVKQSYKEYIELIEEVEEDD